MCDNTVVFPRKLLKKFIQMYRELPCLWDRTCIAYKIKVKRHEAVTKLTELVQEYDPSATRVHILRKIESLRACVRREYNKVQESRRRATCEEDVYVPHLWYYDLFSFVFTHETRRERVRGSPEQNEESDEIEDLIEPVEEDDNPFESNDNNFAEVYNSSSTVDAPEISIQKRFILEEDKSKRHCTEVEDEYDAIGVNVAAKLRSLPANMRILSEKLINDVLFQAQTNSLSSATSIMTPDPFK